MSDEVQDPPEDEGVESSAAHGKVADEEGQPGRQPDDAVSEPALTAAGRLKENDPVLKVALDVWEWEGGASGGTA